MFVFILMFFFLCPHLEMFSKVQQFCFSFVLLMIITNKQQCDISIRYQPSADLLTKYRRPYWSTTSRGI